VWSEKEEDGAGFDGRETEFGIFGWQAGPVDGVSIHEWQPRGSSSDGSLSQLEWLT
jgi:hypothetical protein